MNDTAANPAEQARSLVDHRYRSTLRYEVEREKIREFARAVQDSHPAHRSEDAAAELGFPGLIAPATFSSIILTRVHREILDTLITGYDPTRILHADQVFDFGRPLVAGDRLTCDIYFESFRHFGDYDVLAIKSVLIDQHGIVVQTGSSALLARVGGRDPGLADAVRRVAMRHQRPDAPARGSAVVPAAADHLAPTPLRRIPRPRIDFADLSIGDELPVRTMRLSRGDLVNYAGVTGEANPVLFDERVAVASGLPTVVAPGMLKLGLATSFLSSWLGDPATLTRFRAQFAHNTHYLRIPALGTGVIHFRGRVTSLDPRKRRATVAVDARAEGRRLFGYAAAEVRFP
ncbi:fused (3R)-hydroxyacyl-ACP dehydratase subunits HadA/HadB [Nocardia implantans]|uniref:Fused (3R)-hydroxyacyl-ACP dehydratase subunits HadA/HadB n=1 Tax=Nocardia implantans TaxID=3108168 RepID=A0ABU6ARF5_9NOCA|nr:MULTISPECIES: fused (3R)-hydroxyacyl-ACP dehydratase subunits HadA/HadB [unclassified Nocardia]MBF6191503.1 MaoC family dehydratase N-terminal domain-containing protein [Nocardia beijingensis]MEA3528190.1 fused (3R)-hydroxyacyl-ACP dehydratase subunits HadA/HadB [Nocardia sp. CDC192]MEB3510060.1 fused (3R)-hydroxyacyl-ACP dehydratase subunits HadA/HadB [Nocardia sp. CDC186]